MTENIQFTSQSEAAVNPSSADRADMSATPQKSSGDNGARKSNVWAIVSIALVVIAWVLMMYQGYVALATAVPAVIAGAFGYKSRNAILRYLSVTSIIAGVVLIVVMLSFFTVFSIVLETTK